MGCCVSHNHKTYAPKVSPQWIKSADRTVVEVTNLVMQADTSGDGLLDTQEITAFLSKPIVSKLLTKLTGSDADPAALAPALLARYDIDGNKVLDKRERSDLTDELTRCIREPFFVFLVSSAFQPGDYLSGVAVLDLQKPLAVQDVNIGIRCHGRCAFTVPKVDVTQLAGANHAMVVHHPRSSEQLLYSANAVVYSPPTQVLPVGVHRFRFGFTLPLDFVPSVDLHGIKGRADDAETASSSLGHFSVSYEVVAFTRPPAVAPEAAKAWEGNSVSASPAPFRVVAVLSEDSLERIERAPITSNTHTEPRGCLGSNAVPGALDVMTSCSNTTREARAPGAGSLVSKSGASKGAVAAVAGDAIGCDFAVTNPSSTVTVKGASVTAESHVRVALFAMGSRWEGFLKLDKKKTKIGRIGPGATVRQQIVVSSAGLVTAVRIPCGMVQSRIQCTVHPKKLSRRSRWAADASTVQLISALQLPPYIPSDLPVMAEAAPATSLSGDAVPVVPLVDEGHSTALPVSAILTEYQKSSRLASQNRLFGLSKAIIQVQSIIPRRDGPVMASQRAAGMDEADHAPFTMFSYPLQNFPLIPTDTVYTGGHRPTSVIISESRVLPLGSGSGVLSPSGVVVV